LADLEFSHKRISGEVKKVLESAIANAENNHGLDIDKLKPFSELTIIVREVEEVEEAPAKTPAKEKEAA